MKRALSSPLALVVSLVTIVAIATAVMLSVRMYIVEPEVVARACEANQAGWRCMVREYAVAGFLNNGFGLTALIAAALATVARSRWLALIAILAGVAGAVLYTFELSGVGLLLGALVWVRSSVVDRAGTEHANAQRGDQQHT